MKKIILLFINIIIVLNLVAQSSKTEIALARSSFVKANLFKQNYKLDSAKYYFQNAADLFKKNNISGNYILSKYAIGDILVFESKYKDATDIFKAIEKFTLKNYNDSSKYLTNIYYGLGTVAFFQGDITGSITNYRKSQKVLAILGQENSIFAGTVYSALGNSYAQLDKYSLALAYYRKDIEIRKRNSGTNTPSLSVAYLNISISLQNTGNYAEALKYAEKSLLINLKYRGEDDPETAQSFRQIGSIYTETGQNDLAEQYITRALNIENQLYGEMNQKTGINYILLGIIKKNQANYNDALFYFRKARQIQNKVLGNKHPDAAMTCNNMGLVFEKQGKSGTALSYFNKAIKIKSAYVPSDYPELAVYYNNIGLSEISEKNYKEALLHLKKAASITEQNFGKKTPLLVKTYANIAFIYKNEAKYDTALQYYQLSLAANIENFYPEEDDILTNPKLEKYYDINRVLISLQGKAEALDKLSLETKNIVFLNASLKTYKVTDQAIDIARKEAITKTDKIQLAKQTKSIYEFALATTLSNAKIVTDNNLKTRIIEDAFYFSERSKAAILQEAIDAANAKKFSGIPDSTLLVEQKMKNEIAALEKKIAETNSNEDLLVLKDALFAKNLQILRFEDKLKANYPNYFESKHATNKVSAKKIQTNLPKNTALRSYFIGDSLIFIFNLTKDTIYASQQKIPTNFKKKITDFRINLTTGGKEANISYANDAWELYKYLFPSTLEKEINNLIIIPDGILGTFPFEALLTEKYHGDYTKFSDYPYLIKSYKTSYYYSSNLFMKSNRLKLSEISEKSWLGIAPIFDFNRNRKFKNAPIEALPGTLKEVNSIDSLFINAKIKQKIVIRKYASEQFLKSDTLHNYNYIHIATHGTVNAEFPELSGILLAKTDANDTIEDGMLYSGEIYNLQINAELVVLSACETGLGKISKGEGVIGLSRALLYAGAQNIIVSLWKVADNSTALLMENFYRNLVTTNNQTLTNSLHMAKLKLISTDKFAHPYYWSPFILIGK